MAKHDGKFIRGKVNGMVFRVYRDDQIVQSEPRKKKKKSNQTVRTKKAASIFGKASKLGGEIRNGLYHLSNSLYDGTMIFRLNAEILHSLNSVRNAETNTFDLKTDTFRSLIGFELNINSLLKNSLLVNPEITQDGSILKVEIPELKIPTDLKFPEDRLDRCRLVVMTCMIDLSNRKTKSLQPEIMDIPYSHKLNLMPGRTFEFDLAPGCLCVTAISLKFLKSTFAGDVIVNNKEFNPTAIVHSIITEGINDTSDYTQWISHGFLSEGL
ncbi:MAG: hypothetical protein EOO90_05565 [Pedobacter sp.]|nr:MAG: hypothetical protein EOO90_05565 [Pedobacter sp.]